MTFRDGNDLSSLLEPLVMTDNTIATDDTTSVITAVIMPINPAALPASELLVPNL